MANENLNNNNNNNNNEFDFDNMDIDLDNLNFDENSIDEIDSLISTDELKDMEFLLKESVNASETSMSDTDLDDLISKSSEEDVFEDEGFIKNYSIFDGSEQGIIKTGNDGKTTGLSFSSEPEVSKEELPKSPSFLEKVIALLKKPKILILSISAVLTVVIVIFTVLFLTTNSNSNKNDGEGIVKAQSPEKPVSGANNIYVNASSVLDRNSLTITKMNLDNAASVFYFDSYFPIEKYDIRLVDNEGTMYNMDLSYNQYHLSNTNSPVVLRFDPINNEVEEIYLSINNTSTSEKAEFTVKLEDVKKTEVRYLDSPIEVDTDTNKYQITIEDLEFASTGTTLFYKLKWNDENSKLQHGSGLYPYEQYISIENGGRQTTTTKQYPSLYSFDNNVILGRMDFDSVKDMSERATITFKDLYNASDINEIFEAAPLFLNTEETQIKIDIGDKIFVLERMRNEGDKYVLVYHVEEKGTGKRIEAYADVEALTDAGSGAQIAITGEPKSIVEGGDIKFFFKDAADLLKDKQGTDVSLKVKKVLVKTDDVNATLDIKLLPNNPDENYLNSAKQGVLQAFKTRQMVRYGQESESKLSSYFNNSVLSDDSLMSFYNTNTSLQDPNYSSQIITMSKEGSSTYYAVVIESLYGTADNKETYTYLTHKVKVKQTGTRYIITDDVIIK